MCGIIGYIGDREARPIILKGLKRLEYRGYDSAGIAIAYKAKISIAKRKGRISDLETILLEKKLKGHLGLGHTRWQHMVCLHEEMPIPIEIVPAK